MKRLALILLIVSAISGCAKLDIENGTPKCVARKIKDFNVSSSCNNAKVDEYVFQGNTVYTFEPGTCGADMTTEVISSDCTSLGYLGGIVGNTKINGEEFSSATFSKNVWNK